MLQPGTMLYGRYRIDKAIQEGGMSVVYRGRDTSVDITVAVKEMKDPFFDEGERRRAVAEFHKEAKILASLSHAGLPRVTHFFESSNNYYVIMDFIEGETLDYAATRYNNQVPEALVLQWSWQVSLVLGYLHGQKPPIIFRDLKPANIMVTPDNRIKLIDFGIAKAFEPEAVTHTLIRGAGTPGFAPPEQYGQIGRSHTDVRTDVYALGATMYSLLQGVLPVEATARFMHDEPLVPLTEARPELHAIIMKCLQLLPENRYQTVHDVQEALRPLVFPHQAAAPKPLAASPTTKEPTVRAQPQPTTSPPPPTPTTPAAPAPDPQTTGALPDAIHNLYTTRRSEGPAAWRRWGPVAAILGMGILLGSQLMPLTRSHQGTPTPTPSASASASISPPPSASPSTALVIPSSPLLSSTAPTPLAHVHVSSEPLGAHVRIDDGPESVVGTGGYDLKLAPGPHHFSAIMEGYVRQSGAFTLSPGEATDLRMSLPPETVMRIVSTPAHMRVKVNGRVRGKTPLRLAGLRPGVYH
ncbi:MAG TPA: serine/threonine-protein kinase, partial [Candidatus Xenobia bacterium]